MGGVEEFYGFVPALVALVIIIQRSGNLARTTVV